MDSNKSSVVEPVAREFYRKNMQLLIEHQVPFLIGGAHALTPYSGVKRDTKDFDIFLTQRDCRRAVKLLSDAGYESKIVDKRWLGKAYCGPYFVDYIFNSANCLGPVDASWFEHAVPSEVLGVPVLLVSVEDMIWSKAFVMNRDRFDGADINHLIVTCSEAINWKRLLLRFGEHWNVLLIYALYFRFIYPSEAKRVPDWLVEELLNRAQQQASEPPSHEKVCKGSLFSPDQYDIDIKQWGFADGKAPYVARHFERLMAELDDEAAA